MTDSSKFVLKRIGTYDLTGNRLGKGNFAYVELATNRITKTKVAIKVIDTRKINDEYVRKNILREALLLKKINHPNIVRLYETLKQHSIYCIVTEYVPGGELLSYLRRQNDSKLSESQARPIMRQLISALYHMHQNGIVHRDLKMENILLDEGKKNIKIVDFGLSNICLGDDLLKTQCGSPEYAAPELFRRGCRYGTEVDLWSLGVIMYGIVVGRLPFRSHHYGSRGRSDLLDQTSRGLSSIHNKCLVLLTPHCRDLLRKLLEPNPQMRLPLLDVMVHPWVTVQGTVPLVPYSEPLNDEQLWDKVLVKTSQLINIDKSKIAFHVQQKRYDAISGVYNLLLDEELKRLSRSDDDSSRIEATGDQEGSTIRVSIETTSSHGKKDGAQGPESESASSTDSQDSPTEQDWEQAPTRKHIVSKPNEPQRKTFEQPLEGLRIRGLRICTRAAWSNKKQPQEQPHARTRPNSANTHRAPEKTPPSPKRSVIASHAWKMAGKTRCKSCFPRFASSFDSELHGTRVVMSPRVRQDPALLASQWEAKLKVLASDDGEGSVGHSQEDVNTGPDTEGYNCRKSAIVVNTDVPISKPEATLNQEPNMGNWKPLESTAARNCTSSGTSEVKQTCEANKLEDNKTTQTLQENQKLVSSRGSVRSHKTGAKISPSSLATQSVHRAVSPLKTSQFVDLADYNKYVPQPPKSRIATLGGPSRLAIKTEGDIDSFSAAYQSFVKTKKPQHLRLSIMQAQEILQHESKFRAKYGRRLSTEGSASNASNAVSDIQTENLALRFSQAGTGTSPNAVQKRATVQQLSIAKPGQVRGVGLKRNQRETIVCDVKRGENIEKQDYMSPPYPHDNPTDADHDVVESGQKGRSCINEENRVIEARLEPKQEESLKRQKERELTEGHERERVKFLKELEDKERQKIITEYLNRVYSHYDQTPPQTANKKGEHDTRSYKVSRQGRVCSTITLPQEEHNPDVTHLITSPAPIWHRTARGSQENKKVSFRANQGATGTNGVRFFNEWNNSLFTDYINSSDGDAETGKQKDNLQDPSYWIEQHLDGVLDKTSVIRGQQHHQQFIPRET